MLFVCVDYWTTNQGKKRRYYKCLGKKRHTTNCNKQTVRKEILEEQRSEIQARMKLLKESLKRLDYKIHNYEKFLKGEYLWNYTKEKIGI